MKGFGLIFTKIGAEYIFCTAAYAFYSQSVDNDGFVASLRTGLAVSTYLFLVLLFAPFSAISFAVASRLKAPPFAKSIALVAVNWLFILGVRYLVTNELFSPDHTVFYALCAATPVFLFIYRRLLGRQPTF